jgi:predicted RNase H-like HicB family nuclease
MLHYQINIYWSQEDQIYLAEVPELPGCIADGETYQSALENVQVIMQEWIDIAKELGRNIPIPKTELVGA